MSKGTRRPLTGGGAALARVTLALMMAVGARPTLAEGPQDAPSLADYWRVPLAPQGSAPEDWSDLEQSLAPDACGVCHADKYEEWRTSHHAAAFSPGLVGQLVGYGEAEAAGCMTCHAPLAEQRSAFARAQGRGQGHEAEHQGLAAAGVACASCHVRNHRRFGPPARETGLTGQSDPALPHGGVYRSAFFERSEFCGVCHQFPQAAAINGKPLQNTYAEWLQSPQAARGITCQNCHMPDRRHLWRGIHDRGMVAAGLTPRFRAEAAGARFELTNSGIGHAFPTYVTPKVIMKAVALDADGEPRPETAVAHVIQRVVDYAGRGWTERSDSRLRPGATAILFIPWDGGERVRMWLEVHPDDYYDHQVYDELLKGLPAEEAAFRLITLADRYAKTARYRLFETELERP